MTILADRLSRCHKCSIRLQLFRGKGKLFFCAYNYKLSTLQQTRDAFVARLYKTRLDVKTHSDPPFQTVCSDSANCRVPSVCTMYEQQNVDGCNASAQIYAFVLSILHSRVFSVPMRAGYKLVIKRQSERGTAVRCCDDSLGCIPAGRKAEMECV